MNSWWIRYLPGILREWLEGRAHVQRAVGNTGWLLVDRVVRMVIGVTVGAWVARYLGPAQFGELAFIISFIAFFQVAARLEADGFIVRDLAQMRGELEVVLGTALWLRLVAGVVAWVAAMLLMLILHPGDLRLVVLTAIVGAAMVFQSSDTVDLWFQSQSQSRRTVAAKLAAYLVANGLRIVLLLMKAPLIAFAGAVSFEAAVLALSLRVAYRRFPTGTKWRVTAAQVKLLLNQCWPFIASGLMITTYLRIDQIMIKEMLGERQLGLYAAALPISNIWAVLPSTLLTSLWPFVARKKEEDEKSYQDVMVMIFRIFALAALAAGILTAVASSWIIDFLYGAEFQVTAVVLSLHVFVNLFIFQGFAQNMWLIHNNVRTVTLFSSSLTAVVSVAANFLLIRRFGIIGAVLSVLVAEFVSAVIPCVLQQELRHLYKRAFWGRSVA